MKLYVALLEYTALQCSVDKEHVKERKCISSATVSLVYQVSRLQMRMKIRKLSLMSEENKHRIL